MAGWGMALVGLAGYRWRRTAERTTYTVAAGGYESGFVNVGICQRAPE